jgi:hypothetical protein
MFRYNWATTASVQEQLGNYSTVFRHNSKQHSVQVQLKTAQCSGTIQKRTVFLLVTIIVHLLIIFSDITEIQFIMVQPNLCMQLASNSF